MVERLACLLAIVCVVLGGARFAAAAEPIAIVTDVHGDVRLGDGRTVALLAELPVAAEMQLQPAARLVLIHMGSQVTYELAGPGTYAVRPGGIEHLAGARPKTAKPLSASYRAVRLHPSRIAQASISMRGSAGDQRLRLMTPVATWLLDPPPALQWEARVPATSFRLQLTDSENRPLFETVTESTKAVLPQGVRLEPGRLYGWQVTMMLPEGEMVEAWSEFGIAAPELRARIEAARPAADAEVAQHIGFALLLESLNVRETAREEWAKAARARPGDRQLRTLAEDR